MSKRVLSLVLALVMVLGSFSFVSAAALDDVAGTVYEDAVKRLSLLEILEGFPDGTFKPDATITRAQFAAVAVRAKGLADAANATKGLPTGFSDVYAGHWAEGYITTAAKMGIVNGRPNGTFGPEEEVKFEDAVTMIVRALGYEAAAQTKGGYPYGYLIVANEIGLLDEVKGTQGQPAPRGIVAQITDNALEIPMMIQVGFGSETKWVVSGSKEHGTDASEQYLLDSLGFDSVLGRVTNVSKSKKSLTVTVERKSERDRLGVSKVVIDVPAGFDTYAVEYLETKFWYNDDLVIAKVLEEAKFDAVKPNAAGDEFTLVTEDETYDVASSSDLVTLELNGENLKANPEDFKADYAKVVLNSDDEVVWAKGYTFDDFIVVETIEKDTIVYSYDKYADVDLDDFTIVKEGKTISIEDLVEGDVVFYEIDEEFAVVYNNSVTGVITRTYEDSFKLDGESYDLPSRVKYVAAYLDDGEMDDLDSEALEAFEEAEAEVEVFVDFYGNAVLVVGGRGVAKTNTFGGYLTSGAVVYNTRNKQYLPLDMINENDEKVSFDADKDVLEDSGYVFTTVTALNAGFKANKAGLVIPNGNEVLKTDVARGVVIEYTVDEDGDITEFELLNKQVITGASVKTSAKYASGMRLQNSTVVFLLKSNGDVKEVFTWENANKYFGEMNDYDVYNDSKNNATYLVVRDSDAGDYDAEIGMVVEVNKRSNRNEWETIINIAGTKYTFDLETNYDQTGVAAYDLVGKVVAFNISDDMKEIEDENLTAVGHTARGAFKLTSLRNDTFQVEVTAGTYQNYELVRDAVIFDVTGSTVKTRDLSYIKDNWTVEVYSDLNAASRFIKYVIITNK